MPAKKKTAARPRTKEAPARKFAPKVRVGTVNKPGYSHNLDAEKYAAASMALLKVLPARPPGLSSF